MGLPRFAVVDIETSGMSPRRNRILQIFLECRYLELYTRIKRLIEDVVVDSDAKGLAPLSSS